MLHENVKISLEEKFQKAADAGFRARATSEYRTINSWVNQFVDLDNASILDFGCGQGVPAGSFALRFPKSSVVGFDIAPASLSALQHIFRQQIEEEVPSNLAFVSDIFELEKGQKFDLIYAWSVFEHVKRESILDTLKILKSLLKPGGVMFIHCEPLYFSPKGSLLYKYFSTPWHHLSSSIDSLRDAVISEKATEREAREWQQFLGLNRVTKRDLTGYFRHAKLQIVRENVMVTDIVPPSHIRSIYKSDTLTTTGVQFLVKK